MSDVRIFIGLGANLGDPASTFENVLEKLNQAGCEVLKKSKLYRTKPYGFAEQDDFLNAAVEIATSATPEELLKILQKTELDLGKKVICENGPRLIDLDLLLYGDLVQKNSQELKLPHPGVVERDFVLLPLCDIAPEFIHPETGNSLQSHLAELSEHYAAGERMDW
jgi:2-amino-4-hydroxy-6-hydroxymethyldihydropteridine diphosphokinase